MHLLLKSENYTLELENLIIVSISFILKNLNCQLYVA